MGRRSPEGLLLLLNVAALLLGVAFLLPTLWLIFTSPSLAYGVGNFSGGSAAQLGLQRSLWDTWGPLLAPIALAGALWVLLPPSRQSSIQGQSLKTTAALLVSYFAHLVLLLPPVRLFAVQLGMALPPTRASFAAALVCPFLPLALGIVIWSTSRARRRSGQLTTA